MVVSWVDVGVRVFKIRGDIYLWGIGKYCGTKGRVRL